MFRHLFAILSVLLCLGTLALWVHSRNQWDVALRSDERHPSRASLWSIAASRGSIWAYHETYDATFRQRSGPELKQEMGATDGAPLFLIGDATAQDEGDAAFRHRWPNWSSQRNGMQGEQMLIIPMWMIVLGTALAPGFWFGRAVRARHRRRRRRCAMCGYDLRASAGRCPECGTAIAGDGNAASVSN